MVGQKEFIAAVLDQEEEVFVVYIVCFGTKMTVYLTQKIQIVLLIAKEVTILEEYSDFADIFSEKLTAELPKHSNINKLIIDLETANLQPWTSKVKNSQDLH